jgi:hypothetical protein
MTQFLSNSLISRSHPKGATTIVDDPEATVTTVAAAIITVAAVS